MGPVTAAASALADQIRSRHLAAGRRSVAVCGTSSGVGVSFVAASLARALAAAGVSTLLVDANLERPSLHSLFGISNAGPDLGAYLAGYEDSSARIIRRGVAPRLDLVIASQALAAAGELLSSERLREFIDHETRAYDVTIFDTPPANRSAQALSIASMARYALLVGRRNVTYADDVAKFAADVRSLGAELIGTVFNEV